MPSTQDQIEAALWSILASVGQQDHMYLQPLAEGVQQGNYLAMDFPVDQVLLEKAVKVSSLIANLIFQLYFEGYNGAALNGPVQSAYNDNVGLHGFGRVSQNQPKPLTSSDYASEFAAADNRMLSSAMSRTPNFSVSNFTVNEAKKHQHTVICA
ncbi:unnamed protein product [Allacma fusca]|uniref:Uncharacterized protein n=1 Tax=Allacma fusca TaxID=39272 RepID=A0A8J2KKM3_9HEXA|nr:unnamed protein product [Allacma fusca]